MQKRVERFGLRVDHLEAPRERVGADLRSDVDERRDHGRGADDLSDCAYRVPVQGVPQRDSAVHSFLPAGAERGRRCVRRGSVAPAGGV